MSAQLPDNIMKIDGQLSGKVDQLIISQTFSYIMTDFLCIDITIARHFYMLSTDDLLKLVNKETFGNYFVDFLLNLHYKAKLTRTSGSQRTDPRALLDINRTRVTSIKYQPLN